MTSPSSADRCRAGDRFANHDGAKVGGREVLDAPPNDPMAYGRRRESQHWSYEFRMVPVLVQRFRIGERRRFFTSRPYYIPHGQFDDFPLLVPAVGDLDDLRRHMRGVVLLRIR